jgi:hypothetical protein
MIFNEDLLISLRLEGLLMFMVQLNHNEMKAGEPNGEISIRYEK